MQTDHKREAQQVWERKKHKKKKIPKHVRPAELDEDLYPKSHKYEYDITDLIKHV